jgi:hypothetical protein
VAQRDDTRRAGPARARVLPHLAPRPRNVRAKPSFVCFRCAYATLRCLALPAHARALPHAAAWRRAARLA